jgi:hypothetical protein
MPKLIAQLLRCVLRVALPAHGRRRAAPPPSLPPVIIWAQPWHSPTPAHVLERTAPLRGEDVSLVRPYAPLDDTLILRAVAPLPSGWPEHQARAPQRAASEPLRGPAVGRCTA